jgi:hypothetical protein
MEDGGIGIGIALVVLAVVVGTPRSLFQSTLAMS